MPESKDGQKMDAYLGLGSKVNGALTFTGTVQIDGEVEGEVNAKERLTIGESAKLKAKISGGEVLVMGTVIGDITAKKLSLKKPARITGNITCEILSIEEGVVFDGKATMTGGTSVDRSDRKDQGASHKPVSAQAQ